MISTLHRLVLGFAYLASLGITIHITADQALAQIRPAYTKNVDEPGRLPYQTSANFIPASCTFNSVLYFCPLNFPAVPAGKRLIIEYTSLFVAVTSGVPDSLRFLNNFNGTAFWVQPTFTVRTINPAHFFLDRPVQVYYEPGETPHVFLTVTGPLSSAEMTVHGYLIDAAN